MLNKISAASCKLYGICWLLLLLLLLVLLFFSFRVLAAKVSRVRVSALRTDPHTIADGCCFGHEMSAKCMRERVHCHPSFNCFIFIVECVALT